MTLPAGLYDLLLTESLAAGLDPQTADLRELNSGVPEALLDTLGRQLTSALEDLRDGEQEKTKRQLELVNELLIHVRQRLKETYAPARPNELIDLVATPLRVLRSIRTDGPFPTPPEIGLANQWLFTAGKGTPSLLQEIRRELASADRIDILVSFITVSGVRKLEDVLKLITATNAQAEVPTRIRVLTTTYTGATEARAIDLLAKLPGCEVRISLDGRRTRLHAKAWIFHRRTGFGSAYVGSANLSGAALTGGLEWTIKLSERNQAAVYDRAAAHFETLWNDTEFEKYDPTNDEHRRALSQALHRESGATDHDHLVLSSFFDLQPKSYQQDILEQLQVERSHGRTRNLLVAATGTGKTVIAAFDYRNTCRAEGGQPRLLFVAHREEILRQAQRTYREVLRDPEFGELLFGGRDPDRKEHLFATIDSLTSRNTVELLGAGYWHSVVIDECHRLAGDRFTALVNAIHPKLLLGLTATPERSDGLPIFQHFDSRPDGSPAVELRLWRALDLQLLAPFEYYACDDETDFSLVPWDQPGERSAIDNLVTGNDVRARLAIREWTRLASDPRRSKALVFCASVAHAQFMTDQLNRAGLPSACVVGTTDTNDRRNAPRRLMAGDLCALVTVDLYNEGVDLPMVDTLLLLRPTQSPVLFQQQIGRGLRLAPGKENCLILDFVGMHRTEFRFDRLLSALTGLTRKSLVDNVEHGFSNLPPGCHIHLQKQTRDQVLRSLRAFTQHNWQRMRSELQAYAALRGRQSIRMSDFLSEQALELDDVYRATTGTRKSGWTSLNRDAGLLVAEPGPEEEYFSRRLGDVMHFDDSERIDQLASVGRNADTALEDDARNAELLQMLAYQIDGRSNQVGSYSEFIGRLRLHPGICDEMTQLAAILQTRTSLPTLPIPGIADTPLRLHASYSAREILTAVGLLTAKRRTPFQAGVLALAPRKTELLFVTLDKSEGFHDAIAYKDFAISVDRFHWQSQNSAAPDTPAGRRYIESPTNGWTFQLFVRPRQGDAYKACGPVSVESTDGARPMTVIWKLQVPLPIRLFREFSVLRDV